jgi:hypothetical protein
MMTRLTRYFRARSLRRILALAVVLGIATSVGSVGYAEAGGPKTIGNSIIVYLSKDKTVVVLAPKAGVDKATYDPKADAALLGVTSGAAVSASSVTYHLENHATQTACIPDCGGQVQANFSTDWVDNLNNSVDISGTSSGIWTGVTPWNADSIILTDKWETWGVNVSGSYPFGGGFSGSQNDIYLASTVYANWQSYHQFSGVHFSASSMTRFLEWCDNQSQFGAYTVLTEAHAETAR